MANFTLTTGNDTFVAPSSGSTVYTTAATLNAGDSLTGGAGTDVLALIGSGTFRVDQLASFTGFERIALDNATNSFSQLYLGGQPIKVDATGFLGIQVNSPSNWNGSNIINGDASSQFATSLQFSNFQNPLLPVTYDLTSNTFSHVSVNGSGDNITLLINNADTAGVQSFSAFGLGDKLVTAGSTLDLSHTAVSGFTVASNNGLGTAFTVGDLGTAFQIAGGSGQDTLIAQGLTLTAAQRTAIFETSSIETITDQTGTYTAPPPSSGVVGLTTGNDTFVAPSSGSTVYTTAATLNAGDSLTGGAGTDVLALIGSGTFRVDQLASFTGFERIALDNATNSFSQLYLGGQPIKVDATGFLGIQVNSPSNWNGSNIINGDASSQFATSLQFSNFQNPLLPVTYDLTSNTFSHVSVNGSGDNITLLINNADTAGVQSFSAFGLGDKLVTAGSTLDLSHTAVSGFTVASNNGLGTAFTVGDLGTAFQIAGGSGQDTLIAQGLTLTAAQRTAIFETSSIETITDQTGTYTAPPPSSGVVGLTTGNDTFVAPSSGSTVYTTAATLNAGDSLTGGAGTDVLALIGSGTFRVDQLASFTGFERIALDNATNSFSQLYLGGQPIKVDATGFLGIQVNSPSNWNGSNIINGDASSQFATSLQFSNFQNPLLPVTYDLTSNTFSHVSVNGSGDNITLLINNADTAGVQSFSAFGLGDKLVTAGSTLDLSHTAVSGFTVASNNGLGTAFTVGDLGTAFQIAGGSGQDTIAATGFTFSADQRIAIFATASVEKIVDQTGTYTVDNAPPTITSNGGGNTAAVSLAENTTAVATVTATDPDVGQTLSYSIIGGADASKFTIGSSTGALSLVTAPNFELPTDAGGNNVYDVIVQVSDGHGGVDNQAFAVTVTDLNEAAPVITSNGGGNTAALSIAENTTAVTTVTANDSDVGQTLSYSILGGADASKFTIDSSTGVLSFVTAPNFELPTDAGGNNVYDVIVQVSDGHGGVDTQAIAATVTDVKSAITAPDFAASHNQNIAASALFSVTGDTISQYQLWDSTADPASGHWVVNGAVQGTNQAIDVTAGQLAQTTFESGSGSDDLWVRANDGSDWGAWKEFHVNAPINHTPVATAPDVAASHNQNIAASALFSVTDGDGDTISKYQLWDSTADPASGHWVVNGAVQGTNQAIDVTAGQLAQTTFQSGSGSDDLWVRANDGSDWGAWKEFHVNAPINHAPVATAPDVAASHNQNIAASALFSVTDGDGDTISKYQLWDSTADAASGHWVVNGAVQGTNQAIDVTAGQLAQTTFQSGSASDDLWVRANDGSDWGAWKEFHVNAPINHAPVATAPDFAASHNQNIAASALFSVTDGDGDSIAKYQLWDSTSDPASGHWSINGVVQGTNQAIDVTAGQLAQTTFQSGSASDDLWVRANDGSDWGAWKEFHVNAPINHAPVATAPDFAASHNQNIAASALFSVTDGDGDSIAKYQLWDSTSDPASGHWSINGVVQGTNQAIDVTAGQLAQTTFQSGSGSDDLWMRANDGTDWGAWKEFHVNAPTVLDGHLGAQTLTAGGGPTTLIGGPNDILNAGAGADTFVFRPGFGSNTINGFAGGTDAIEFDHTIFAYVADVQSHMQQIGSDVVIAHDPQNVVTLHDTLLANIHTSDFHIV